MDNPSVWISAASILISTLVIWRSGRILRQQRRDWVARWKDDPEILAIVLARLGWFERKRLKKELGL